MENRSRPQGLAVRGRKPLQDLTSQRNNRQTSNLGPSGGLKQGFTIYQDNPKNNDENAPPGGISRKVYNDENASANNRLCSKPQTSRTVWPAPPELPLASSSPAESFKTGSKSGAIGAERKQKSNLSPNNENNENLIDPFALVARSSASDFRRNNDSINSVSSEEDDEQENSCDDLEGEDYVISHPEPQDDEEAEEELNLSNCIQEALNNDYALDILKCMIAREVNYLPKWNYMTKQPDITFTMRSILIDWLIEVGEEYKLHTETIFLAVNYIDRFLSFMSVQRAKLQLVGTACMFIAAKYEEIYPPDVTEFCYITDDTYTKRQVLRMEQLVMGVLNFECSPPTGHFFVNHIAGLAGCTQRATFLAQYLTELTLIDGEAFMPFSPSIVACAAVALSRHTLGLAAWEDPMITKTGYQVDDFKECLIRLHETFTNAPSMAQQAVREKYKAAKYESVSEVKPTPIF